MRKHLSRLVAMLLVLTLLCSLAGPALAATYRPGAQSGPSTSYKNGMYYKNYTRVPITGDGRTDVVAIALSQLGYQEGNSNGNFSGEVSGRYNYVEFSYNMGEFGLGYGGSDFPWCASFVSWCLYQSRNTDQNTWRDLGRYHVGDYKYIWKEISCSQWVRQLKGAGYYKYSKYEGGSYTPKYGDLVFFQNSNGVAHIGICLYVSGGRIYTVEGNTSDAAGLEPNGGGVYFKNYSLSTSYINGYGVLPYKTNSSVPKIDYSGANPTPGLYVANATKYIYATETASSHSWLMSRFTMFEVTEVCSNGRLKVIAKDSNGVERVGYVLNSSDRVIQLSSSVTDATDTARATLQSTIKSAQNIRHYNYTEAILFQIRDAYNKAVTLVNSSSATAQELTAAAANLRNLLGSTGSNTIALNNKGVYINGRNGVIGAGDCYLFSDKWNNGLITVTNANIRYTVNVVCGWDVDQQVNVVKSVTYGTGNSTPSIQLGESEFLIAAHDWETGISSGDNPVAYSGTNYQILSNLKPGDKVIPCGATALNAGTDVEPGAFLKFIPADATVMTGENERVGNGAAVLFTPDFNSGLLTAENANIHNTLNVVAQWDDAKGTWIVVDKFSGNGASDSSSNIELADGQVLIACHVGDTTPANKNWQRLYAAQVGQQVIFSGISPTDGAAQLSVSANISFTGVVTPETPPVEKADENLASGKDYIVKLPGTSAYTAGLTDGTYATALEFSNKWFGFMFSSASANCNTTDGAGLITIDLGGFYDLSAFKLHVFSGDSTSGIGAPSYIDVYTSSDGENFFFAGSMTQNISGTSYWAALEDTSVVGRYVRLAVGQATDYSPWTFINEMEIYGSALEGDENVAFGGTQTAPSFGYTAGLTDGVAGDAITDAWQGLNGENNSVIIDLHERFKITGIQAHLFAGENTLGAGNPTSVAVSVSVDGENYSKLGDLELSADASAAYWAGYTGDAAVGRYVKLEIPADASLTLLNEVQVFGTVYSRTDENNIAMGKSFAFSPYTDSPFTALLNDGLASDVFQYGVNNESWFGFRNTGDSSVDNVTNGRGIVTIVLGGQAEINSVSFHLWAGENDAGAVQPGYINVYYSNDGEVFDYACTVDVDKTADGAYWLNHEFETPLNCRYFKFGFGVGEGSLVLVNEIKVNGLMLTNEEPGTPGSLSGVTLAGSFNNWNSTPNMVNVDDTTVSGTLELSAGTHTFKVLMDNQWYGNNGTIYDTTLTSSASGWVMDTASNDCTLVASYSGKYRFTLDLLTNALTVIYLPEQLYLRGDFNDWGTTDSMVAGEGCYTYTKTLLPGTYEYKVADGDYQASFPVGNASIHLTERSEVTFVLNIYDGTVSTSVIPLGHEYDEGIVTAPTCTAPGYTTYTCTACGYTTQIEDAPALGHSYENNQCTTCGQLDPDYNPQYALYGFINGQDYDGLDLMFENGKLAVRFDSNSYVAIRTDDGYHRYMADSYITGTSGTFLHTSTGAGEKMLVPGGVNVIFTLVANEDGSLTLSYEFQPIVQPTITVGSPSVSFEGEIRYNIYFSASQLDDVAEMGLALFNTKVADGTVETADQVIPGYTGENGSYMVQTDGIAPKNMGDALYFRIYAKLTDGSYVYTDIRGYNAIVYANNILKNSTDANMRSLVVAMLNYGAAAQQSLNYKTDSLMNAGLTAEQQALVKPYDANMMDDLVAVDASKVGNFAYNSAGFSGRKPSVSFDGAFAINYYFTTKFAPENGMKLYYWTLADYNACGVLTAGNATGSMDMTDLGNNQFWGHVENIVARDIDQTVFVAAVYTYGGVEYATGVLAYSVGSYCESMIAAEAGSATQAMTPICSGAAVYGFYAKEYFSNLAQ